MDMLAKGGRVCTELPYFPIDNAHLMYNAHRRFFPFTEHFCIDNARVIDGKIRYYEIEQNGVMETF
jgi:hypothetical protein